MVRNIWLLVLAALALGGCGTVPKVLGSQPMRFECRDLKNFVHDYDHRRFAELQADAYAPGDRRRADAQSDGFGKMVESIARDSTAAEGKPMRMLVLSGGGQWGAYGAGFLAAMPDNMKQFDVVTGISTGAIQSLFVGAGEYDLMRRLYGLEGIGNPAFSNKLYFVSRGSEHNIGPLRATLNQKLYQQGEDGLLHKIAKRPGAPRIVIGLVEGYSTRLKVVDLTGYIAASYPEADDPEKHETLTRLADCVSGVVLGSSSIPLRLTPVQIDYGHGDPERYEMSTFMDGGVRLSVIDRFVESSTELSYATAWCRKLEGAACTTGNLALAQLRDPSKPFAFPGKPQIFIVRNGPTIVPQGDLDTEIDRDPDAYITALRGYSVLVNQNELASITELQSRNRYADLHYTDADGYDWITGEDNPAVVNRPVCEPRNEKNYFDARFMDCLRKYGAWRQEHFQWQRLASGSDTKSTGGVVSLMDPPPPLPDSDLLTRAQSLLEAEENSSEGGANDAQ